MQKYVNKIFEVLKRYPLIRFIGTKLLRNFMFIRANRDIYYLFPFTKNGISGYKSPFYRGKRGEFYTKFYSSNQKNIFFLTIFYNLLKEHIFAYEIFEARKISHIYKKKFKSTDTKILAISHFNKNKLDFRIKKNDGVNKISIIPERLSYLKLDCNEVEISSKDNFLISENFNKNKVDNPKLVVTVFIDGLNYIGDLNIFKQIAPNTYNFFLNKGHMFTNHYSNSEWTVPSFGNVLTGKYTHNHGIFHPDAIYDVGKVNKLMPEYFQEQNYLTFMCNSIWRNAPSYGFVKGFDRTIYKKDANSKFVINESIEHINAFKKMNQFCFLNFNDLHHDLDISLPVISQVNNKFENVFDNIGAKASKKKSVERSYDVSRIEKLKIKTLELDIKLKQLFNFIENDFSNNYLVNLFVDHGHAFLSKDPHILSEKRTLVPWLIKSSNINDYSKFKYLTTSNVDILPTILDICNISTQKKQFDGVSIFNKLQKREKFLIESIYPNKKAFFKYYNEEKFFNVNSDIDVDYYGYMKINSLENQNVFDLNKIINNWNKNFKLSETDFR